MHIPAKFLKGLVLAILFAFSLTASSQQSDWKWQNPLPQGHRLYDVHAIDENVIYATGVGGTVMKSIDGGDNWILCKTGIAATLHRAKFLQNGIVGYVSGENASLIKTTDSGVTWQNLSLSQDIDLVAMDFPDELTGYVSGTPGYVIYKTTDGGSTWSPTDSLNMDAINVIQFPFDNLTGFASGSYGIIFKTVDGGVTWIQKSVATENDIRDIWFVNNQVGYAAGPNSVMKTSDYGETWVPVSIRVGSFFSICFPENESTGFAANSFTVIKTTDGGSTWKDVNPDASASNDYFSVDFVNNQLGYVVGNNGILFKTTNGGLNWTKLRTEVTLSELTSIDFPVNAQTGYIAGESATTRILKTTNGGETWIPQGVTEMNGYNKIKFLDNDTGYVVGQSSAILKTVDGGKIWNKSNSTLTHYDLFDVEFPVNSRTGYVSGLWGRLAKTTDGGSTWNLIGSFTKDIRAMCFPTDNLIGYVATADERIYKTTDGGASWKTKYDGKIAGAKMNDILFPFDAQTGYAISSVDNYQYKENKILKTTDGGDHWQIIDPGNTKELLCIFFVTPHIGYIGAEVDQSGAALLMTTDSGLTWERVPVPFGYHIRAISFPNGVDTGYIAGHTAGSILKTINGGGFFAPVPDLPAGNQSSDKTLVQNYPNPFTESTTITWQLPRAAHVILKVYDFTGREIETLADYKMEKGVHHITFEADGMPAGIYFYKIQADGRIITKKMIQVK